MSNNISERAAQEAVQSRVQAKTAKRRPHTKSRSGCVTCKRRRVKCDETRPICRNCSHLQLECRYISTGSHPSASLQMTELRLMVHYMDFVAGSISDAGIATRKVWRQDVVELAFQYPFLMHAILMFSATHLAQQDSKKYEYAVVQHRSDALALIRTEVQNVHARNLDALVAASVLFILDAMANASMPDKMTLCSLPASAWLHHVRGAATVLLAVGVLPPTSRFYSFMGMDLLDLANTAVPPSQGDTFTPLQCFIPELADLYPVTTSSPYYSSLLYLDTLYRQRNHPDYILRVFSFPALMDSHFVTLLASNDAGAKRIVGAYYCIVRNFCQEMKDRVWFLQGVATVLPIDTDTEFGGLGFITSALPVSQTVESILQRFDASFNAADMEAEALFVEKFGLDYASSVNLPSAEPPVDLDDFGSDIMLNPDYNYDLDFKHCGDSSNII